MLTESGVEFLRSMTEISLYLNTEVTTVPIWLLWQNANSDPLFYVDQLSGSWSRVQSTGLVLQDGNWKLGSWTKSSYLTVEDGRAIQETVEQMHQNIILLKNQEGRNAMWDNVTRATGVIGAVIACVIALYKKMSGIKKLIPSTRGQNNEMTVLPTIMRSY